MPPGSEPLRHPDDHWWERYEPISGAAKPSDICRYCGHVRYLHANGCNAPSSAIMGNPAPCDCTNTATGRLYVDPTRPKPLEPL